MVVRGGYGTYYNTSVYNTIANNMAQQPPFAQTLSISSSPVNPLTFKNGFCIIRPEHSPTPTPSTPTTASATRRSGNIGAAGSAWAFATARLPWHQGHRSGSAVPAELGAVGRQAESLYPLATSTNSRTEIRFTTRLSSS